jgi:outer membrane protein OmpU
MNNFKKIGVSALAGSLATFSANAADLSVSGATALTYTSQDNTEVTGNPMGMKTNILFSASGELDNGFGVSYFVNMADNFGGTSSAKLSIDMGDMGTIAFDQGSGSGIDAYDDVMPTANEEVWDGLDTTGSGLTGQMDSAGTLNYINTFSGIGVNAAYRMGSAADNADGVTSGSNEGGGYSVVLTASGDTLGVEGLNFGVGYGQQEAGAENVAGHNERDNEDMTAFAKYAIGPVTVGYQRNYISKGGKAAVSQEADIFGIAFNVNENLAVSYGEKETDFLKPSAAHTTEKVDGIGVSYTMGSMKIAGNRNEGSAMGGVAGTDDTDTEIMLSFSF